VISGLPQQDAAEAGPADVSDCPQQDVSRPVIAAILPLLATFPYLSRTACRISSLSLICIFSSLLVDNIKLN
jgi:hypothetical protein